jgi:hypothetical protein
MHSVGSWLASKALAGRLVESGPGRKNGKRTMGKLENARSLQHSTATASKNDTEQSGERRSEDRRIGQQTAHSREQRA